MLDSIFDLQRWLYGGAVDALKATSGAGVSALPMIVVAAFGFGMLHALLPGHGKAVLASHYAGGGRIAGAVGSSAILIAMHVGSALILVLGGIALLQRTISGAGRAPLLELASQILIVAVGTWMLWRAFRPHAGAQGRSGPVLALAAGMVPCPLTTFIMSYAVTNGIIASGLILSGAFAAGMIATVALFPTLAVLFRYRLVPIMARSEVWRSRVGHGIEIAAAAAVIAIGLSAIVRKLL